MGEILRALIIMKACRMHESYPNFVWEWMGCKCGENQWRAYFVEVILFDVFSWIHVSLNISGGDERWNMHAVVYNININKNMS